VVDPRLARDGGGGTGTGRKRGPGARAGRRDYSHLPRFEVFWDFPAGGYCCPECGEPFTPLGDHWSGEQLDWQVIVRVAAHCRRRYKRACDWVAGEISAPSRARPCTSEFMLRPAVSRSTSSIAMNAFVNRPLPTAFGGPGAITVTGTRLPAARIAGTAGRLGA